MNIPDEQIVRALQDMCDEYNEGTDWFMGSFHSVVLLFDLQPEYLSDSVQEAVNQSKESAGVYLFNAIRKVKNSNGNS